MAGGGQRGLSFLGEDKAFTAAATALVILLTQALFGCINAPGGSGGGDAEAGFDDKCEAAFYDRKAGDDFDEVVLNDPLCQQHMAVELRVRSMEQQSELQEATP